MLKNLHRISGILISIFVFVHLFNHAMAWFGIEKHEEVMVFLRKIYRNPVAETLLVSCFSFQVFSGIKQFLKLRKEKNVSTFDKLQIFSGLFIAYFIIQHLLAVLGQRYYFGFDTNFYFASRVVLEYPFKLYFVPYYFLGIVAFGVHLAMIHRKKISQIVSIRQANFHSFFIISTFFLLASMILYVFMGFHYEILIPKIYEVY